MALVECGRFPLLPQALVARSALEAAGLHAFVFDEFRASLVWTEQFSLGGIRVMVPPQEVEAALALLSNLDPPTAATERMGPPSVSMSFMLLASIVIGWPMAGFRRPGGFHRVSALILTAVTILDTLFIAWRSWRP